MYATAPAQLGAVVCPARCSMTARLGRNADALDPATGEVRTRACAPCAAAGRKWFPEAGCDGAVELGPAKPRCPRGRPCRARADVSRATLSTQLTRPAAAASGDLPPLARRDRLTVEEVKLVVSRGRRYLVAVQVPDWWALLVHVPDIERPLAEIAPTKVATYPGAKLL
jgi:hypothetical protein